jgi:putative aminopeptidase
MPTLLDRLKALAAIDAIAGQEQPLVAYLRDALTPCCDEVTVDAVGNLYAVRRGAAPGPTVLIAAHTDEIGLIVKSVEPTGFLRFDKVGGVVDTTLPARLVRVGGRLGVIGMRAGHYQTEAERGAVGPHTAMYVDVGATSAAAVADLGIAIGDPIAFASDLVSFGPGDRYVAGKAVDNRLGCAVLWALLEGPPPPAGTLVAVFTSQEEVGLKGAAVAGRRWQPDLALALDTMPAGDTPDMSLTRDLTVTLGGGPALQVSAGRSGTSFLVSQPVKRYLQRLAAEAGVPLQLNVFSGGGNDAGTLAWSGLGVPTASLCLPRRYAHSPLEVADLHDADATLRLLGAVVAGMAAQPGLGFLD